ncbi:glycosyltransferase [Acetobacter orientalis]|uniref:glycosyltransferase n=1 Tax=Acetobacter orientalis TaxID=146474 RepID=UPI00209F5856|nr:glycosyltransferase [Acetobacter orientalis]MCP1216381.1 glycosyltransferase [Acetobacter orientalis]MCP1219361.1 glycosyltransferase [Acetobacter orientalis]
MKIHYLVTSLENGGAEFAIPSIVQSLQRHGCEVKVIACEPRDMKAAPKLEAAKIPYEVMFDSRQNVFTYTKAYLKRVKADRPDVIWTSLSGATMVGQLVGKLAHIPVVSWKHSAAVRIYTQIFRQLSQLWIADSAVVEQFLHQTMRIPKKDILSWPLYYCDTQHTKTNFWDGKRTLRIGSMGRLREQKNYVVLIEAIDTLLKNRPDLQNRFTVSIAGRGPLEELLKQKIDYYKLQNYIYLLGYNEHPLEFLETLDIYIQPSTFEGMCLAAHEAMAASLPVIATPVGELAYSVIDKETGFLVTGDLKNSIAVALEHFFDEPDAVVRYGKKAQKFVSENYSLKNFDEASGRIVQRIKNILVKRQ